MYWPANGEAVARELMDVEVPLLPGDMLLEGGSGEEVLMV